MTKDKDLHHEAEEIREETAAGAPELAEHDRVAAKLPLVRAGALVDYFVARPTPEPKYCSANLITTPGSATRP